MLLLNNKIILLNEVLLLKHIYYKNFNNDRFNIYLKYPVKKRDRVFY
jgi:hypothetical protein